MAQPPLLLSQSLFPPSAQASFRGKQAGISQQSSAFALVWFGTPLPSPRSAAAMFMDPLPQVEFFHERPGVCRQTKMGKTASPLPEERTTRFGRRV